MLENAEKLEYIWVTVDDNKIIDGMDIQEIIPPNIYLKDGKIYKATESITVFTGQAETCPAYSEKSLETYENSMDTASKYIDKFRNY